MVMVNATMAWTICMETFDFCLLELPLILLIDHTSKRYPPAHSVIEEKDEIIVATET
jgi:hypothetical protein